MTKCFLMKAEPDIRMEKGHDVSFSVDMFEQVGVTSWEGVRSHLAKKVIQEMKLGDKVLFYASNCKIPGITALATVVKEFYPDHNSWDSSHPYFDPKSNKDTPTWFMVDVKFDSRLNSLVGLKLLQLLSSFDSPPEAIASYLTQEHLDGIKSMALLRQARLSVQRVEPLVYEAVELLGTNGGWEDLLEKNKGFKKVTVKTEKKEVVKKEVVKKETVKKEKRAPVEKKVKAVEVKVEVNVETNGTGTDDLESETGRRSKRLKKN